MLEKRVDACEKRMGSEMLRVTVRRIPLGMTGSEVCTDAGESCVAVRTTEAYDRLGRFWGHDVIGCNARVNRRHHCLVDNHGKEYDYMISPTSFRRSPKSVVPGSTSAALMCLKNPYYDSVVCSRMPAQPSDSGLSGLLELLR